MPNSKQKGNRGERSLRDQFREAGFTARRTQQYCGNTGDASDVLVEELPTLHFECKNTEAKDFLSWIDQAARDCKGKTPVVCHKRNYRKWIAMLNLEDLIDILRRSDLVKPVVPVMRA